jgi:hypothetical protein
VDESARVVAAGRRDLDAVRKWVIDAAASTLQNAVCERMQMAIVQKGIAQVEQIIAKEGPQFVGPFKEDTSSDDEWRKNQIDAFRRVYGHDPNSQKCLICWCNRNPTNGPS